MPVVTAFRSERVVITVKVGDERRKVCQIIFARDGSLFVSVPYFRHRTGILAAATIPGNGQTTSQVDLQIGGKVSSHLVKYSHHPDGRAHFSQDGKVYTVIKRQSIALNRQRGHMFSVLVQGLSGFDEADDRDVGTTLRRTALTFEFTESSRPEALKIVGRWYQINELQFPGNPSAVGPWLSGQLPDGGIRQGVLLANPGADANCVLFLTCETIPRLGAEPEILMFYGGFDPREVMDDTTKDAGFLGFLYPANDAEELRTKIGSVDFSK